MRVLKAGVTYFLLVFAGGWIMGPIRELWAVPHFGPTMGLLLEAVIMLIAMIVAARWVVRWFEVPQTLPAMISMGLLTARVVGACRDCRCRLGARPIPPGLSGELCEWPRCHFTDHVPAFCDDADACDAGWVSFPA
jgi:hypothetical protein